MSFLIINVSLSFPQHKGASEAVLGALIGLFCDQGGNLNRLFKPVNGWSLMHSAAS